VSADTTPSAVASPWLDIDAAAAYLHCSAKHLYRAAAHRRLVAARVGKRLLFRVEWLDAFAERQMVANAE